MVASLMPGGMAALRHRFVYRPELGLLYDRRSGLEHQLNQTARVLVEATFADGAPESVASSRLGLPLGFASAELARFWSTVAEAPRVPHPRRKSGAPPSWTSVEVPFPLVLELELTRVCNWHCDFCYNVWKVSDQAGRRSRSTTAAVQPQMHLSLDRVRQVFDEAAAGGCLRIRLSGGEPLLHPQFRAVLDLAWEHGFDLEVFTNGALLTPEMASFAASRGVRVVLVSVHGLSETHQRMAGNPEAFGQALRGVEAALASGMTVMVESLVSEENVAEMPPLVARLRGLGVRHVSFMPYVPTSDADPRRRVLLARVRDLIAECQAVTGGEVDFRVPCAPRHCLGEVPTPIEDRVAAEFDDHCAAGVLWASVSYDGGVRHCPHSAVFAGSVEDGIGRLWRERVVPTVRDALRPADAACGACGQFGACQGGCHLPRVRSYPDAPRAGTGSSGSMLPIVAVTGGRKADGGPRAC